MHVLFLLLSLTVSRPPLEATPQNILSLFRSKWDSLRDYTCIVESYERLGRKKDFHRYEFLYLKPGWIWMKVIEGKNKGGIASYNPFTKKVRGKKGGILGVVKLTLAPTNKRVISLRGYRVDQSDFGTHLKRWEEYMKNYNVTLKMDTLLGQDVYRLDATGIDPAKYDSTVSETIWISPKNFLPLKLEARGKGGIVFHRAVYRDVKINQGLTEEDFKI